MTCKGYKRPSETFCSNCILTKRKRTASCSLALVLPRWIRCPHKQTGVKNGEPGLFQHTETKHASHSLARFSARQHFALGDPVVRLRASSGQSRRFHEGEAQAFAGSAEGSGDGGLRPDRQKLPGDEPAVR